MNLNEIRKEMARYMLDHPRASMDSALFHVVKLVYKKGFEDGKCDSPKMDVA